MKHTLFKFCRSVGQIVLFTGLIGIGLGLLDAGGSLWALRHFYPLSREWLPFHLLIAVEVDIIAMLLVALVLVVLAEVLVRRKGRQRDERWKLAYIVSGLLAFAGVLIVVGFANALLPPLSTTTTAALNGFLATATLVGVWWGGFRFFQARGWSPWKVVLGFVSLGGVLALALFVMANPSNAIDRRPPTLRQLDAHLKDAPNVLILLIDTLRADHLPTYGYNRATAPFLDKLAREGILFRQAYAPASYTLPSVASLFTSLYTSSHGITRGDHVPKTDQYLPYVFQQLGYNTSLFAANPFIHQRAFGRGVDYGLYPAGWKNAFSVLGKTCALLISSCYPLFRHVPWVPGPTKKWLPRPATGMWYGTATADELNAAALHYLRDSRHRPDYRSQTTRFFMYIHYIEPHSPYDPPPPFLTRFGPVGHNMSAQHEHKMNLTSDELAGLVNRYDGEIAYIDDALRRFFTQLEKEGHLANTLVIVTSDHGEEFNEHGGYGHGKKLFQDLIHIPLIVWSPDLIEQPRERTEVVSLLDIFPTLLGALGIQTPDSLQGRDLSSLIWGPSPPPDGFDGDAFSELLKGDRTWRSYHNGRYHYIVAKAKRGQAQPNPEEWLFDLQDDPREQRNLIAKRPALADRMRERFREMLVAASSREEVIKAAKIPPPKEHLARLRNLGYLDSWMEQERAKGTTGSIGSGGGWLGWGRPSPGDWSNPPRRGLTSTPARPASSSRRSPLYLQGFSPFWGSFCGPSANWWATSSISRPDDVDSSWAAPWAGSFSWWVALSGTSLAALPRIGRWI